MNEEFVLDRDAAQRVAKVVRRVERMGVQLPDAQYSSATPLNHVCVVKWNGNAKNSAGYYPGVQVAIYSEIPPTGYPPLSDSGNISPPGYVAPLPGQLSGLTQDCWIQCNSDATPTSGDLMVGVASNVYTDGLPIYVVGAPVPGGNSWFSASAISSTALFSTSGAALNFGSISLPAAGSYLITCTLCGAIAPPVYPASPSLGTASVVFELQNGTSNPVAQTGRTTVITFPWLLGSENVGLGSSFGAGAINGAGTWTGIFTVPSAATINIVATLWLGPASTIAPGDCEIGFAYYSALLVSNAVMPSASTINGLTGGIILQGGGNQNGVGIEDTTSGTTITTSLTPAALASGCLGLAFGNW